MKRVKKHKGHIIAVDQDGTYRVFTEDEWSAGEGFRYPEWEATSLKEAIEFIA